MLESTEAYAFGPPGTHLCLIETEPTGSLDKAGGVIPHEPDRANWLPAQPHGSPFFPVSPPAVLYTRGINAGGFDQNKNALATAVRLARP